MMTTMLVRVKIAQGLWISFFLIKITTFSAIAHVLFCTRKFRECSLNLFHCGLFVFDLCTSEIHSHTDVLFVSRIYAGLYVSILAFITMNNAFS